MKEDLKKAIRHSLKNSRFAPDDFEPSDAIVDHFYRKCIAFIVEGNIGVADYLKRRL